MQFHRLSLCGLRNSTKCFGAKRICFSTSTGAIDEQNIRGEDAESFARIVRARRSVHRFDSERSIDRGDLDTILRQTLRTPSGFNLQPFKCIVVGDKRVRKRLAQCMIGGNIRKVLDAPITAVFVADLQPNKLFDQLAQIERDSGKTTNQIRNRLFEAETMVGGDGTATCEPGVARDVVFDVLSKVTPMPTSSSIKAWSYKNTSLAVQSYLFACTALGIGTAPMEGFDGRRVREVLGVPARYEVAIVVPTGYPASDVAVKESLRFDPEQMVCLDGFDHPWIFDK